MRKAPPRRARALVLSAALLLAGAGASRAGAPLPEASFDYLYVEANEGGSSGGHAAVRFGTRTYHFQNRDGLLVLDREPTRDFLRAYALVNNRTITSHRVALDAADAERLRATFDRRYHLQRRQLDVQAALREDLALLDDWQAAGDGPGIRGLGYFQPGGPPSLAVADLRARIEARYGPVFLAGRRTRALEDLAAMAAAAPDAWPAPPPARADDEPPFARPWSRRYRDAAASVAALDVLRDESRLDPEGLVRLEGPAAWLADSEIAQLRGLRRDLDAQLVRLAGSPRSDWGRPFLIALARLLALDVSISSGRLVVLEVLPDDAQVLPYRVLAERLDQVGEMILGGRDEVERARRAWTLDETSSEVEQTRVEEAASRVDALETSVRRRTGLALARGSLLPTRAAPSRTPLPRGEDPDRIAEARARVLARATRHRDALERLYRYQLIRRNCVSELFHTLDRGLGGSAARSRAVLGGHIDGSRGLAFIPFVSARAVDREYRVVDTRVVPSYREIRLAEMRRWEHPVWVALRESNTWTARSYRRGIGDSYFVFFTDDAVWLRPVFGAVNLAAGVLEGLWGVVRLPVDGGDTLVSGLEGALVSLPELAFWNIRKGSNDWVAPRARPLDALLDDPLLDHPGPSGAPPDASDAGPVEASRGWSR